MTEYIQLSAPYMLANKDRGKCAFCGECDGDKCFVKLCPSCSEYWKSPVGKDLDDGRPARQYCPECSAVAELTQYLKDVNSNVKGYGWRDAFCYECPAHEVHRGKLDEFAESLFRKGWCGALKDKEVLCPDCRDKVPSTDDPELLKAEEQYASWKETR